MSENMSPETRPDLATTSGSSSSNLCMLSELRLRFSKIIVVFLWANVGVNIATGLALGKPLLLTAVLSVILALVPSAAFFSGKTTPLTRYLTSASTAGMIAVLVNTVSGTTFQLDMHMYFFAALALIAGWCDWRAIVTYSAVVAVHHLSLNFVYPLAVFPDGANFIRVILHAVIVVLESAFLIWLTKELSDTMTLAATATGEANKARDVSQDQSRKIADMAVFQNERIDATLRLIDNYRRKVSEKYENVEHTGKTLASMSTRLSQISDEASLGISKATDGTRNVSDNVTSVAGAAGQLSDSVGKIERQISNTVNVVAEAKEAANSSNECVGELAGAVQKIGAVVALIQDIAEQTNLLALNATIEAARAGEMGKGFAVVAAEVKTLANQTAKATSEISAQIASIQTSTGNAVAKIEDIVSVMSRIDELTASLSSAVSEQGAATSEISHRALSSAKNTDIVVKSIEGASSAMTETNGMAREVQDIAGVMSAVTHELSKITDDFLREVEAQETVQARKAG